MALFRRKRRVEARPDGRFDVRFSGAERARLKELAEDFAGLLGENPDEPSLRRLFPAAYPDDAEREAEYQLLAGEELRTSRQSALEVVVATAEAPELSADELAAWMQAVNSVRLVLGTILDVSEEASFADLAKADLSTVDGQRLFHYHYLSEILMDLVSAQADTLR